MDAIEVMYDLPEGSAASTAVLPQRLRTPTYPSDPCLYGIVMLSISTYHLLLSSSLFGYHGLRGRV